MLKSNTCDLDDDDDDDDDANRQACSTKALFLDLRGDDYGGISLRCVPPANKIVHLKHPSSFLGLHDDCL